MLKETKDSPPSSLIPEPASELAAAREQVRALQAELEEKRAEVELLHEVAAGIAAAASVEEMLDYVAATAIRVSETDSASIYVLDDAKGELTLRAVKESPHRVVGRLKLKVGEGITGWVARELQPVALEREAYKDPRFKDLPDLQDQRYQSFLSVPMVLKNQVTGVLNVKTRAMHRYPAGRIRLLSAIAAQAAAAIEGARIHDRMSARETQLSAISEVSKTLTSNLYLEEILQLLVAMTARTMSFKICSLMLFDPQRDELVIKATQSKSADYLQKPNLKIGESVAGRAVQERRILTVLDVRQAPEYRFPDIAEKEGLCSMICVPLLIKDRCIGVLNCYTGRPHHFSEEEIALLSTLANHAAIAIENAKLMVRSAIIQEMHHRVKNSLQTVASLLRLQMRRLSNAECGMRNADWDDSGPEQSETPRGRPNPNSEFGDSEIRNPKSAIGKSAIEGLLRESINRIVSIAAVHELLAREELDQVDVKRVAETILALTGGSLLQADHRVATLVEGDEMVLPSSQATPVALILNELVHNAIEHGFATRREGTLRVTLEDVGDRVRIEVTNDGQAPAADFEARKSRSLGLQIVESLARGDLGGRFEMKRDEVTRATLTFPREPSQGKV